MKLFDSHCHIDDKSYNKDFDDVLKRAEEADVKAMMIAGITEKSSQRALSLAENRTGLYISTGIHPHDAKGFTKESIKGLKVLAKSPKVRAWGETGLDFNRMYSPKKDQEKCLISQLEAADELKLPLIFHERDSGGRFLEILNTDYNRELKGVVHCFSGNEKELNNYLKLGLYIGITGIITIKTRGEYLRKIAPMIPADRILIETDAPYLTPAPEKNHNRRNEPAFVRSTMLKLAEVRNEDPVQLSSIIWNNTCRLYDISGI
ncbi:MAG: TatD family hydrolase [Desulfobacterales bacterium]|nr:TatD family hydrolase [Desulfobacterales bacterium]